MGTQFQSQRSGDAVIISPQIHASHQELNLPISRKRRISVESPSDHVNPPLQRPSCLFFKTRLCSRFRTGECTNWANCNFAHGSEELRRSLPDRQKICKKFYRGEVCTYGERCLFMHVEPGMLGEDVNASKGSRAVLEFGDEWDNRKTRMCRKCESLGYCPFGERCHFAHGHAELKEFRNPMELDSANPATTLLKDRLQPVKGVSLSTTMSCVKHHTKGFLKWEGLQKVSHIYADWIEDMPLRIYRSPSETGA